MAGNVSTHQSIRKALGALKDSTTVGLAKVNSDYKELDVAIVKATNHVEMLAKEKHIRAIFDAVSASRPRADVAYCINALARRLAKTHNWAVALKTLIVIHRALREVDPTFREELINYSRNRGHMLNLSHFKDDSSPSAWDYSAWVRQYALFIEERLECFCILKYDVEKERSRMSELDTVDLLDHLPAVQQLLFRLLSCQPEGAAAHNNIIRSALSIVASESIKIYNAINGGTINLVDKFFEMQRHDALRAVEIYRKAGYQAEKLSEFYEICKRLDLGKTQNFTGIEKPSASFIQAMEEYMKDASRPTPPQRTTVDGDKRTAAPVVTLAIEHNKLNDEDEKPESATTKAPPKVHALQTTETTVQTPVNDLLGFDDVSQSVTQLDEKNALALAVVANDYTNKCDPPSGTSEWELALVGAPSSNDGAVTESKLAGGLDKLTLDSLYESAITRSNPTGSYHMGQVAPNPFEGVQYSQDPFFASNSVAPPANVQMAAMAQQQALMMQGQQQTVGQDSSNPFGNPFVATAGPTYPSQYPYTGFM